MAMRTLIGPLPASATMRLYGRRLRRCRRLLSFPEAYSAEAYSAGISSTRALTVAAPPNFDGAYECGLPAPPPFSRVAAETEVAAKIAAKAAADATLFPPSLTRRGFGTASSVRTRKKTMTTKNTPSMTPTKTIMTLSLPSRAFSTVGKSESKAKEREEASSLNSSLSGSADRAAATSVATTSAVDTTDASTAAVVTASPPLSTKYVDDDPYSASKCARMSRLFLPYLAKVPHLGEEGQLSKNYRLLTSCGFVLQSQAGMFHVLPLGLRVLNKIKRIIVEEMEAVGCQEMTMSSLTSSHLWERSGRWKDAGAELFRLQDRRENQQCLAPTCEENITAMMSDLRFHISHKQLPIKLFQISTKYRDELVAKNGLLRGREFLMKDLYTFDRDVSSSLSTYASITTAYERIFARLSLPVLRVAGSPGKIGGSITHEFQLPCSAGEDEIVYCANCKTGVNADLLEKEDEWRDWKCQCPTPELVRTPSIELGHTFLLGVKYSAAFEATYAGDEGGRGEAAAVLTEMGCYGIGVSRLVGACAEVSEPVSGSPKELVWPPPIAPFSVGLLPPKKGSKEETPEVVDAAADLIHRLSASASASSGDLVVDDRIELTIGRRLADLKRIGVPFVVVVAGKFKSAGLFELIDVYKGETKFLAREELLDFLSSSSASSRNV